jgi:hypothetical protein
LKGLSVQWFKVHGLQPWGIEELRNWKWFLRILWQKTKTQIPPDLKIGPNKFEDQNFNDRNEEICIFYITSLF